MTIPVAEDHEAIARRMRELGLERSTPAPSVTVASTPPPTEPDEIETMMAALGGYFPYMGAP